VRLASGERADPGLLAEHPRWWQSVAMTSTSPRPAPRVSALVLAAAALVASLGACADDEAGLGLPTLSPDEADALVGTSVENATGALHVESNGCFSWRAGDAAADADAPWIVWPEGFEQDDDGVLLAGGGRAAEGTAMTVSGVLVLLDALPDGATPDSYLGSFGRFCHADERGVIVLTDVTLR